MDSYCSFAEYYTDLMSDAGYAERCAYILELLKRHAHPPGLTLDLACGTGSLTRELFKNGVDVYGVDASEEMLAEAMRLSCEEGMNILFLKQKMQELDLYGTIDTCICTLDSVNHLTTPEDVAAAFDRVGLFMNKDGLFVFDVNTIYKHREVLADNAFVFENENFFCAWQNTPLNDDIIEINLDFFEEDNGVYYRSSECFCERAYSDEALREMLVQAGFTVEAVYGDLSFEGPRPDEQRAIYVARMKNPRNKEA